MPATQSSPYLFFTYSITNGLALVSISMSISGIDERSGDKNLEKYSPFATGSISVIFIAYETMLPADEPLPGPIPSPTLPFTFSEITFLSNVLATAFSSSSSRFSFATSLPYSHMS